MNKSQKFLRHCHPKLKKRLLTIIKKVLSGDTINLDARLLMHPRDVLRIRVGNIRLFFRKNTEGYTLIDVKKRDSKTYSNF